MADENDKRIVFNDMLFMYLYNIDMLRDHAFTYLLLCSLAAPFLHFQFDCSLLRCIITIWRDKMLGKSTLTRAVWIGYESFESIYFGRRFTVDGWFIS